MGSRRRAADDPIAIVREANRAWRNPAALIAANKRARGRPSKIKDGELEAIMDKHRGLSDARYASLLNVNRRGPKVSPQAVGRKRRKKSQ